METRRRQGGGVLWLVVLYLLLVGAVAVVVDAPTAAALLAVLCAVLATLRAVRPEPAHFRARSRSFDVTVLVMAALALGALAPAGYLA